MREVPSSIYTLANEVAQRSTPLYGCETRVGSKYLAINVSGASSAVVVLTASVAQSSEVYANWAGYLRLRCNTD